MKTTTDPKSDNDPSVEQLIGDLTSNIYGIVLLLTLSSVMLLVHLYLAFFFHNR